MTILLKTNEGFILTLGGILVLIFFIHHIADSLQITLFLDNITFETKETIEKLFPDQKVRLKLTGAREIFGEYYTVLR